MPASISNMLRRITIVDRSTFVKYTERLSEVGVAASVGTVGDSYDDALAETINGLYKTELIEPRGRGGPSTRWSTPPPSWVEWFNHRRLYQHCADMPPAKLEAHYYAQTRSQQPAALSNQ